MPAPNEHVPQSYPIDLWEVLNTIAHIPPSKGPSVYSKANRTAMNEAFNHFYCLTMAGKTETNGAECPINKNLALNWLKSNILFHVHQCDASPNGSEERAKEQARIDAFSSVYDLIRFNL